MEEALEKIRRSCLTSCCRISASWHERHRGRPHAQTAFSGSLLLMLTVYDDDDRIFDAMCAGAVATC
jgi:hypothetical protein